MATQGFWQSSVSILSTLVDYFRASHDTQTRAVDAASDSTEKVQSEEQTFLASIAHLPADQRAARLQQREWYKRLAERQGVIDAEWRSNQYLRTHDKSYRLENR